MVKARVIKQFGSFQIGQVVEVSPADFEEYNDHLMQVCNCQKTTANFKEWLENRNKKEFKNDYRTK